MNLSNVLEKKISKREAEKIAAYIIRDNYLFKELIELFFTSEYRVLQKTAWILSICVEKKPDLIKPYLGELIKILGKSEQNSVKRTIVRILQYVEIHKKFHAKTISYCFNLFTNTKEAIAIRVFAMSVLYNLSKEYKEIRNELAVLIEDELPYAKPAYKSRGKKILALIQKNR